MIRDSSDNLLGPLEFQIVSAALYLGPRDAYGMKIRQVIEHATGRRILIGSVYMTLDRLQKKKYIRLRLGDPTPVRGGRAKEFIEVTGTGQDAHRRTWIAQGAVMDLLKPEGSLV